MKTGILYNYIYISKLCLSTWDDQNYLTKNNNGIGRQIFISLTSSKSMLATPAVLHMYNQ